MRASVVLNALLGLVLMIIGIYSLATAATRCERTTPDSDVCVSASKGRLVYGTVDQQTQWNQLAGAGEIVLGLVLVGVAIARARKAST